MANLFILGTGPLLEADTPLVSGQCLRTWHFAAPLLQAGHQLRLLTVPIPGATRDEADPPIEQANYRGTAYGRLLSNDPTRILPLIRTEIERSRPDALVGINAYPAWLLARLERSEPFWADLNGWTMAEGQVRAAVLGHNRDFAHFWKLEARTLLAADRFSTVTRRQADALYGELAMLGALTHLNVIDNFVSPVANAVYPDFEALQRPAPHPALLNDKVPSDAPIILWSGGFNSWTDLETLISGLHHALDAHPPAHLVCTGGAVKGHDEKTYEQFLTHAKNRLPTGRWHPLGWIDYPDVLALHARATIGINVEGLNTESRFGARNRLTNMLGAGLAVVTTRGTEIAEWIDDHNAGWVVPPGDGPAFGRALAEALASAEERQRRASQGRQQALLDFAPANTLTTFLRWAESPEKMPRAHQDHDPAALLRRWILQRSGEELPFTPSALFPSNPGAKPAPQRSLAQRIAKALRALTGKTR